MKKHVLAALALAASGLAFAQGQGPLTAPAPLCERCGTIQSVHQETRKGEGGAVGIVGGAVVGGLLGNQIGKGNGRALATVGGAVAGGYAGNEVQKHATRKTVWVSQVRMRDGSLRRFEHGARPGWHAGQVVRLTPKGNAVVLVRPPRAQPTA